MRIRRAKEHHASNPHLKVAIYGDTGTGKTTWAACAPRPLVLAMEAQAVPSIVAASPEALVVEVGSYADFRDIWRVIKLAPAGEVDGQPCLMLHVNDDGEPVAAGSEHAAESIPFQTVVLDSFTELQRMMIDKLFDHSTEAG